MTKPPFPQYVDSSMIASFKSCQKLFDLTYLNNWKPKDGSVHLTAGGAFAKGIEVTRSAFYNEGNTAEISIAKGLGALMQAYGDYSAHPNQQKLGTYVRSI